MAVDEGEGRIVDEGGVRQLVALVRVVVRGPNSMPRKAYTVEQWKTAIEEGLDYRRKYGLEEKWHEIEALFYAVKGSGIGPNLIYSVGDSLLSSLTVPQPYVMVRPKKERFIESAPIVERCVNYLIRELDIPRMVMMSVLHAYLWGRGILKVGYDSEFGWDSDLALGGRDGLGLSLTKFDDKGWALEFKSTTPGMPWVFPCLPHDIVVPWGTVMLPWARWITHRVVRHVDEVKSDPKYINTSNLKPQLSMRDFQHSYKTVQKAYRVGQLYRSWEGEKAEYVEIFEIRDRMTGRVKAVSFGHDKYLRDDPDELQIEGLPYVPLGFVVGARAFWSTPDAWYQRQPQAELDDISVQASASRRLMNLLFAFDKNRVDQAAVDRAVSAQIGAGLPVDGDARDILAFINHPTNYPLYQDAAFIRRNARELAGMSSNQQGEFGGSTRRTAEEVHTVERHAMRRTTRRENCLKNAYEGVVRKLMQIVFTFWKTPRIIDVVGENGARTWIPFTGEQIKGEYDYDVMLAEEPTVGPTQRRQEALNHYLLLREDSSVDQVALRTYLQRAYNDVNFGSIWTEESMKNADMGVQMSEMRGGEGGV